MCMVWNKTNTYNFSIWLFVCKSLNEATTYTSYAVEVRIWTLYSVAITDGDCRHQWWHHQLEVDQWWRNQWRPNQWWRQRKRSLWIWIRMTGLRRRASSFVLCLLHDGMTCFYHGAAGPDDLLIFLCIGVVHWYVHFLGPLINAFKFTFTGAIKSAGFFRVWKVVSASCARGCARARCPLVGVVWSQSSTGYQRRESEAKNPLSLTAVIICLAKVNYHKIIERQKSGRPMQVNGAFYSIEKSRVIIASMTWLFSMLWNSTDQHCEW